MIGGGYRSNQQGSSVGRAAGSARTAARAQTRAAWAAETSGRQLGAPSTATGDIRGAGPYLCGNPPRMRRAATVGGRQARGIKMGREHAAARWAPLRPPPLHPLPARLVRAVESREWTTPAPSSAELPGRRIARRTYEGHLPSSVRSGPTSGRDHNLIRWPLGQVYSALV